jgi:HAD superfamily hydrolase (TIGR01662 family)
MNLYIFDKDGTVLRCAHKGVRSAIPPLTVEDQILLPGVFEKVGQLRAAGNRVALASNQGAVAFGVISLLEAEQLMENCAAKLGGVDAWRMSPFDRHGKKQIHGQANDYARDDPGRKPHPGMILELMSKLGVSATDTIMIGNSKNDREAAKAAGVRYVTAKKFFAI